MISPTETTSAGDRAAWFGGRSCRAIADVEDGRLPDLRAAVPHRYAMPADSFEDIGDVGRGVSRRRVVPSGLDSLSDLPGALAAAGRGCAASPTCRR